MTEVKNPQAALYAALSRFQAELPEIATNHSVKTAKYSYDYADLAVVSKAVLPLLAKHGLAFTSMPTLNAAGKWVLAYKLVHEDGGSESGEYPLTSGDAQTVGSAITYARRYCLYAVTGVFPAGEDDDGQKASDGYRHAAGEAPRREDNGGRVTRPQSARQQAAAAKANIPDDWQVTVDGIATREDADKTLGELRELWRAKKIAPAVANAVSEQIRVKAARFPAAEAVA